MSDVTELYVAAGTLETARVPESIHSVKEESVDDLPTTSCATSYSIVVVVIVVAVIVVVVVRCRCRSVLFGAVHIVGYNHKKKNKRQTWVKKSCTGTSKVKHLSFS